jgi:hypothetical protein
MKSLCWCSAMIACSAAPAIAVDFEKPVRLKAGDEFIRVEAPGWAFPCLFDVNRDGTADLVVGQFNKGKMRIHKGLGDGKFGDGEWLKAAGDVAEVPGVW